jgi:hypothetical protein
VQRASACSGKNGSGRKWRKPFVHRISARYLIELSQQQLCHISHVDGRFEFDCIGILVASDRLSRLAPATIKQFIARKSF